nr:unnamed protein product [Digitaria exilis]
MVSKRTRQLGSPAAAESIGFFAADLLVERREEEEEEEEEKRVGGGSGTGGLRAEKRGLCLLDAALEISRPRRKEEQPRITIREAEEKHRTAAGAGAYQPRRRDDGDGGRRRRWR